MQFCTLQYQCICMPRNATESRTKLTPHCEANGLVIYAFHYPLENPVRYREIHWCLKDVLQVQTFPESARGLLKRSTQSTRKRRFYDESCHQIVIIGMYRFPVRPIFTWICCRLGENPPQPLTPFPSAGSTHKPSYSG
jgi:hypothetical protein